MVNSSHSSWSDRDRWLAAALVAASVIFIFLRFGEFPVGAGMDDAHYIELARSIAEGRGPVIHLNDTGGSWQPDTFPLGFPLLLSPLALMAPDSVIIFKLVPLLAMAGLFFLCLMVASRSGMGRGLVLAALVCLNPWVIAYAARVFSDLPFTAVSLGAVLLFWKMDEQQRPDPVLFAAVVIATGAAVMVRSIGLALFASMIIHNLIRWQWRRALLLGGGVAVVLLPHALAGAGTGGGLVTSGYLAQGLGGGETSAWRIALVAGNLIGYLKELPVVLLPVFGSSLDNLAARAGLGSILGAVQLILGAGLLAGIVRGLVVTADTDRNRARFLAIYLTLYGGVLLNFAGYPSGVQPRLLLPVLPFMFLLLLVAGSRMPSGRRWLPAAPAVILVLALSVGHNIYRAARPLNGGPGNAGQVFIEPGSGADWIRNQTDKSAMIMTRWPLRQHIHFLRPVVGFGTGGADDFMARIKRYRVDYVFLDSFGPSPDPAGLGDFLRADPEHFPLVHHDTDSGIRVFRVGTEP